MKEYFDFSSAAFITAKFENYFGQKNSPWGQKKPALYQHTDLVDWIGLPVFIKDFDLKKTENTKLYFSALGCVEIYINGKRTDFGEMKPGWSDYNKRALYWEEDISDFVVPGKNRILAVVSPGWYCGRIAGGYYGENPPSVIIAVRNGKKVAAETDTSWVCNVCGQIRTADIWDGEYRDNRETDYTVMSETGYDVSKWKKAKVFNYKGEVTPFIGSKVKRRDRLSLKPENIKVSNGTEFNGTHFGKLTISNPDASLPLKVQRGEKVTVDFGQETVGRLHIRFRAAEGVAVKMRYAEFLNDSGDIDRGNDGPDGSVYTINLRSALGKAYCVAGKEKTTDYAPTFTFFGYRYVEISSEDSFEIVSLKAEVVGNDNIEIGKIETSDELVNKLISNALWGQRGNYLSVPTDCPQRDERLGWTGDAQAFSITAGYNADVYGFFRKWMQDMRDSQGKRGGYADVNPRVGVCNSENACAWGDAGVIIPYNMYMLYGDKTILKEHYDSMEKYIKGLIADFGMSGPVPRYGDWLAYDWCDNRFVSSAYFVHDCDLMIKISEALGKKDRAEYYTSLRAKAQKYFSDKFLKNGKPKEKTQCNKILALAFNLVEDKYKQKLADELEKQIRDNGNLLSCGFLGTYNLCPTLSLYGKDKMAYNLLLQRKEPSWLYSVDQGSTTIWERWNSYTKEKGFGDVGMNSFNHYAYGSVVEWMYRYMAGIEPAAPGFRELKLQPRIDLRTAEELPEGQKNIKWVKASYNSASGLIRSEWNTEKGLVYKCTVPKGVKCTLTLPAVSDTITVNGVKQDISGETVDFELKGGNYTFIQK